MSDEAERAWERWAKEHRSDIDVNWVAMTAKEAFLAGFEAGAERPVERRGYEPYGRDDVEDSE